MKTLKWAKSKLTEAFRGIVEFFRHHGNSISAISSSLFVAYAVAVDASRFYITAAIWIIINSAALAGSISSEIEQEEKNRKLFGGKRITTKDARGNYSVNEADIHKAIFMLGQLEDFHEK